MHALIHSHVHPLTYLSLSKVLSRIYSMKDTVIAWNIRTDEYQEFYVDPTG